MANGNTTIQEQAILDIRVSYDEALEGIAKYKQSIEDLKAAQKGLKDELKNGTISAEEYAKEVTAMDEQIKSYRENIRVLSKEIQNNVKQEGQARDSLKAMRAELSNLTAKYDSLSAAERKVADQSGGLKDKINELTNRISEAEQATQRFYRNVGNYENSIKNAIFGSSKFGNSLRGIAETLQGGGMNGLIAKLTGNVKAFGSACIGMLSNPYVLALIGVAGAATAFKWWYDYNLGLSKATRLTREFSGLTGDALADVRDDIQVTADQFGKEYEEVLRSADTLVAQYGISWKEAVKVIQDGFVSGADLSGDMLQKVQQFAPAFNDAGISASELVALIQQTRSGIFSTEGMESIRAASKKLQGMTNEVATAISGLGINVDELKQNLADGSMSMMEAIQMVTAKMKELPENSQEVGNAMRALFEEKGFAAGKKQLQVLSEISTSLDECKETTGSWGKAQEKQLKASKELTNVMTSLFDSTQSGFKNMSTQMKYIGTKLLTDIIKRCVDVINWFIEWYNESYAVRIIVEDIILQFKNGWASIKLVFNLFIDAIKRAFKNLKALGDLVEGVFTFDLDKVKAAWNNFGQIAKDYMGEFKADCKSFGKEVGENIADAYNKAMNGRLQKITIRDVADVDESAMPSSSGSANGTSASSPATPPSGGARSESGGKADDSAKREAEEVKKANELIMQLYTQTYEDQRTLIAAKYEQQISIIQEKLSKETNISITMRTAMNTQIAALEELKNRKLAELDEKEFSRQVEVRQKQIEYALSSVKKGTEEEYQLKLEKMENEQDLATQEIINSTATEEEKQALLLGLQQSYEAQKQQLREESNAAIISAEEAAIAKRWENQTNAHSTELERLQAEEAEKLEILNNCHQMEGESLEAFLRRKGEAEEAARKASKSRSDAEVKEQQAKVTAIGGCVGSLSKLLETAGADNKAAAKASKVLALAEIAISQGVAIANGVKSAMSTPFPANIAAIATTIATIVATITSAISTVKSAKFARGGAVFGEGTATSDSIPARLSNGESVMTAAATSLFAPVLSAFNQLGGGVPIVVNNSASNMGENFLAAAVAKGFAMCPSPVVSVEEINTTDKRVQAIDSLARI